MSEFRCIECGQLWIPVSCDTSEIIFTPRDITMTLNPVELVKQSYDYPACAWGTPYAARIGKRKLLSILRYLAHPDRKMQPKNRVYRGNRKPVNNLWDDVL